MKHYAVLLATDDSAVEAAVRSVVTTADGEITCIKTSREAVSTVLEGVIEGAFNRALAIVDLDLDNGGHTLLKTAGGALPVIAIARQTTPWLSSMLRKRRIRATVAKPVSVEKLRAALDRVRRVETTPGRERPIALPRTNPDRSDGPAIGRGSYAATPAPAA